jgi:hypothetical protein
LANGGYIIKIKPIAMGIFVDPTDTALLKFSTAVGKKYPIPTPTAMARNIHNVKKRSKVESLCETPKELEFADNVSAISAFLLYII